MLFKSNSLVCEFTVLKNPPQPENGEVEVFYGGGPRYRKQSCHGGFSIACDSGLIKRIVEFGPRRFTNSFIICVEGKKRSVLLVTGSTNITLITPMIFEKKLLYHFFC